MANNRFDFDALIKVSMDEARERIAAGEDSMDVIHEIVDSCIPIYSRDVAELWIDLGMREPNDYGASDDTINNRMVWAVYEYGLEVAAVELYDGAGMLDG